MPVAAGGVTVSPQISFTLLSILLFAHIVLLFDRQRFWLSVAAATGWVAALAGNLAIFANDHSVGAMVGASEAALLAALYATQAGNGYEATGQAAKRVSIAVAVPMLALFGLVHLLNAAAIASLMPGWIAGREIWPLVTGGLLVLAAAGVPSDRTRPLAAFGTAAMFASWLPLVHLPRLLTHPTAFEWAFALMALCLIGAMLIIAKDNAKPGD